MGLWHTHASPNLGQKSRPNNNQQQKKKKKEKKRTCKIVDFAVPADHKIKLKECEKKDNYLHLEKAVEHEDDYCTNRDWCFWYSD